MTFLLKGLITLVLISTFLTSCGTRLVYNNLDVVIAWYIDDYIELNNTQSAQLELCIDDWLSWHREQQLPRYVQQLQLLKKQLNDELSAEDILGQVASWEGFTKDIFVHILPDIFELSSSINPSQWAGLFANLERKQQQQSAEDYFQYKKSRLISSTERYLGEATLEQRASIDAQVPNFENSISHWDRFTQEWMRQLAYSLIRVSNPEIFQAKLTQLLVSTEQIQDPQLVKLKAHNRQVWAELMVTLWQQASPQQKRHFFELIDTYIEDMQRLSRE